MPISVSESAAVAFKPLAFKEGIKRGLYFDVAETVLRSPNHFSREEMSFFEGLDVAYRALCAVLYNYAPASGHPGGSISSGRIAQFLAFGGLDYDISRPDRHEADVFVYAAGHKAMGLYALWALRNELVRIGAPDLLPAPEQQLRLEDLLGFRRNANTCTPLFKKFSSKALDGHPTPAIPFVKVATGASGAGVGFGLGLALGAMDIYPGGPPKVHILEGEGGLTAGRAHEALAAASSNRLWNVVLHLDWNQASIDSDRVCPENGQPGDYVQWTPAELFHTHDWNVIAVSNGHDMHQVRAAQELAVSLDNKQPTAIIYRTIKGWRYGLQGRGSHGAGHKFASESFYAALEEFERHFKVQFPRLNSDHSIEAVEKCYWETLLVFRKSLESHKAMAALAAEKLKTARSRLNELNRAPRKDGPELGRLYCGGHDPSKPPKELRHAPGSQATLRGALCAALGFLNKETGGAIFASAADLAGSTSLNEATAHFGSAFYNSVSNPKSRLVALGGICEDAMGCIMAGLSSYGRHIGVTSSYAAFISALEHIPARMHAIGQQAASGRTSGGRPYDTFIMINAHAGVKTGEDGPTHADPQALQLLQGNFPRGTLITLTPWDSQEIWALLLAALSRRPAVLAPFVTRPPETVPDRKALGLPGPEAAAGGVYAMARANSSGGDGTVVLQGNASASVFAHDVLPRLRRDGYDLNVFYVASAELFQLLPESEREAIFPSGLAREAMGITDFTLPTMQHWVRSKEGLERTLHPFKEGVFLGSGKAEHVIREAGADADGQFRAITAYVEARSKNHSSWC